jgi:carbamoyltransferase
MRRPKEVSALASANLAYTGQLVFCELEREILANLFEMGASSNLVLGGGCALNSSANGQILERTPFERLHVPPAPGDDGNALGAAILAFREDDADGTRSRQASPYLGSSMSPEALERARSLGAMKGERLAPDDVVERAAELLAEGKILGWVQGRAEFGPRALGNRSILADPRTAEVKDRLNATVKFREEFRPFAPSILHEHGEEYFEHYQESRYMERTLRFRPEVRDKVPGVVHEDGTGRLQTVKRDWNPRYHGLLEAFYRRTGVPIVLNTSFNVMGKPIVHSVEDALAVFCTSGLDAMIIENDLFEK